MLDVDKTKELNELLVNKLFEMANNGVSVLAPHVRSEIAKILSETGYVTETEAGELYDTYANNALAQVNVSLIIQQSFVEIEGIKKKLEGVRRDIENGAVCRDDQIADQLNKNLKACLDIEKLKLDTVYKHLSHQKEEEKINIAKRRLDLDNTSSMLNVAMHIDGSFEEKANRLQKMLSRHADVIAIKSNEGKDE